MDENLNEQLKDRVNGENVFRMSNKEMFKLFRSFMKNFIQQIGKNDMNNIYIDKSNPKFQYYPRNNGAGTYRDEIYAYNTPEPKNNMIENGPISSVASEKSIRVEDLAKSPVNKREKKALKHMNAAENERWDKI